MVKKTLLSLAIAATAAGMAGCQISSVEKHENKIVNTPPSAATLPSATAETYPLFDPANSKVPLGIDFLFGINSTLKAGEPGVDGTANTADTTPPVTTAINKLDGFSTVAPIYIDFNAELNPATVVEGATVFLFEMLNSDDDPAINPLDLAGIAKAGSGNPIDHVVDAADYEANYIKYTPAGVADAQHTIQILLKKPLEAKTKYLVVLTNGIRDVNGDAIGQSPNYALLLGKDVLPSRSLNGARTLVQTWNTIASAALNGAATPAMSYTFTTGAPQDVLKAMAAPELGLVGTVAKAEAAIISATIDTAIAKAASSDVNAAKAAALAQATANLDKIAAAVIANPDLAAMATALGVDNREKLKASVLAPYYHKALVVNAIAPAKKIDLGLLTKAVDAPQSRDFKALMTATTPVVVPYNDFFTSVVPDKVEALIVKTAGVEEPTDQQRIAVTEGILSRALGAAAEPSLNAIALSTAKAVNNAAGADVVPETNGGADARSAFKSASGASVAGNYVTALTNTIVSSQVKELSSGASIYQGGLKIPNYLPDAVAGKTDDDLGSWSASDKAARVVGRAGAPRDRNGSTNVTYRFPFADKVGDSVIPVMAVLPDANKCPKPADGYPVAIYQHGITVDRTAGVLVANALAKGCVATVAIDHAMHGVSPTSSTGITFNVEKINSGYDASAPKTAALSPFALARKAAVAAGSDFFAALKERHNNVGKNANQQNVAMTFKAAGAETNVGASGDLYINLQDFARTRDGMRQTVIDLLNLNASLENMDINADGKADELDSKNIYFVGHSLGGIIGTTFVAVNNDPSVQAFNNNLPKIKAAVLGNAGGGVVKLLENSPSIGAMKILPGLKKKAALEQGSANLEKFFGVFQAMVDSADPINFAYAAHMQTLPILAYTSVGDAVVPNNALAAIKYDLGIVEGKLKITKATPGAVPTAKSYLSGTDPLVSALNITTVVNGSTGVNDPADPADYTKGSRFSIRTDSSVSDHATFSSANYADTFTEIFTQVASFMKYSETGIKVTNSDVLEQAAP